MEKYVMYFVKGFLAIVLGLGLVMLSGAGLGLLTGVSLAASVFSLLDFMLKLTVVGAICLLVGVVVR